MIRNAAKHVSQPGLWINVVHPARHDQAVQGCRPRTAAIRTGEQP
jgi:hypothetical protein